MCVCIFTTGYSSMRAGVPTVSSILRIGLCPELVTHYWRKDSSSLRFKSHSLIFNIP